jgi:ribose 5-phosphate isomerase B
MKITIGADHAGYEAKEELKKRLRDWGHTVTDVGTESEASCDYPDFAEKVARAVAEKKSERGVLICGTGNGMAIAANKVAGVRAAVVTDLVTADLSRRHNDSNVFCAGARVHRVEDMSDWLKTWLDTPFDGGRHERRVAKIGQLD